MANLLIANAFATDLKNDFADLITANKSLRFTNYIGKWKVHSVQNGGSNYSSEPQTDIILNVTYADSQMLVSTDATNGIFSKFGEKNILAAYAKKMYSLDFFLHIGLTVDENGNATQNLRTPSHSMMCILDSSNYSRMICQMDLMLCGSDSCVNSNIDRFMVYQEFFKY